MFGTLAVKKETKIYINILCVCVYVEHVRIYCVSPDMPSVLEASVLQTVTLLHLHFRIQKGNNLLRGGLQVRVRNVLLS